jgi:hypothetical protein
MTKVEIIQEWIKRLRSGKYKQGNGALCTEDAEGTKSYCCLGVLCELAVEEDVIPEPEVIDSFDEHDKEFRYNYDSMGLTEPVIQWSGIDALGHYATNISLAADNDDGKTFKEIAYTIETKILPRLRR